MKDLLPTSYVRTILAEMTFEGTDFTASADRKYFLCETRRERKRNTHKRTKEREKRETEKEKEHPMAAIHFPLHIARKYCVNQVSQKAFFLFGRNDVTLSILLHMNVLQ